MSWQDIPLGAVPEAVMGALGVGSDPFYYEAGVGSAWWRGQNGEFQKWLEGAPIDLFAPHRLEDTRLHALPSRFNPQNQHFDASLASNAPINLFAPHRLEDTRLHGDPEGLGISIPRGSVRTVNWIDSVPGGPYVQAAAPSWDQVKASSVASEQQLAPGVVWVKYGGGPLAGWVLIAIKDGDTNLWYRPTTAPLHRSNFTPFHFNARLYGNPTGLAAAFVIPGGYASIGPSADALATRVNTGGCTTASFQECQDFQNAWNAAGGTPSLLVDGIYGTDTASALNDALLNTSSSQATPQPCVTTPTPTPAPTTTTTTTMTTPAPASTSTTNWTPWIIGGVVAAGALGGLYMYKKKHGRMPRLRHA